MQQESCQLKCCDITSSNFQFLSGMEHIVVRSEEIAYLR